jgi:hypothetical protein
MQKTNTGVKVAACLAASVLLGTTVSAEIIYDNSSDYTGQITPEQNAEIGDSVTFAGTARTVTDFKFEYSLSTVAATAGNELGQVFFYANDGGNGLPGTLLYTSPVFGLVVPTASRPYETAEISGISVDVPDSITWTVKFSGIDSGEQAGLLFYTTPTVGSSPTITQGPVVTDYTVLHNTSTLGWDAIDHPGVTDNLGAQFTAVPEPSTLAIFAGGLGLLALRRRKA